MLDKSADEKARINAISDNSREHAQINTNEKILSRNEISLEEREKNAEQIIQKFLAVKNEHEKRREALYQKQL